MQVSTRMGMGGRSLPNQITILRWSLIYIYPEESQWSQQYRFPIFRPNWLSSGMCILVGHEIIYNFVYPGWRVEGVAVIYSVCACVYVCRARAHLCVCVCVCVWHLMAFVTDPSRFSLLVYFVRPCFHFGETLLQDLFSWHPVTTTQHPSWKNCIGFPFQNVLSIKSLLCVSVL